MQKHTLFIADLHLNGDNLETTELFFSFLKTQAPQADALYILGDLFKLWVGDDDDSPFNQQVKQAIKELSQKIPVYLMPGNRDFLLSEKFTREAGAILLPDPYKIDLYGQPTLLTHGDMLCSNDIVHQFFRIITRPAINKKIFLSLPFKFRSFFAREVQKYSSKRKKTTVELAKVTPEKTIALLVQKYHVSQLIYGHIHVASISNITLEKQAVRCIVLGDWVKHGSVLAFNEDGNFELQTFHVNK